jgi:CDP-diacylglycerol--glycerol-3-phosphate 3-phosphatidyltransferase
MDASGNPPLPAPPRINWGNVCTGTRLVLAPIVLILFYRTAYGGPVWFDLLGWFLAGIGLLTDLLDGKLARKYGQVTKFGKIFDPMADVTFFAAVYVPFVDPHAGQTIAGVSGVTWMPVWMFALFCWREITMHLFVRPWCARRGLVLAARPSGKHKVGWQSAAVLAIGLFRYIDGIAGATEIAAGVTLGATLAWACWAFLLMATIWSMYSIAEYTMWIRRNLPSRSESRAAA